MRRAVVLIKPLPHYRRDSFVTGLGRLGIKVVHSIAKPGPGDVLVTWNLTGGLEKLADTYKKHGASVLVVENGYFTPASQPVQFYAISKGGHCGSGTFPVGDDSRWQALGVQPKPWITKGHHILVCGQRGIGSRAMASPHGWHQRIAEKLQRITRRPVRVRPHPGTGRGRPLSEDLRDAWAVVIWSSSCGVRSLIEGIPTYYAAPHWICSRAAMRLGSVVDIEQALVDDEARMQDLQRMAWGQWLPDEIATGEPLRRVLEC